MTEHLGRTVAIGVAGFVLTVVLVASAAAGGLAGALTGSLGGTASASPTTIPPAYLTAYIAAAASCPGLSWSLLAAIGTVESDNGTSTAPGVQSGANSAGAEGPMQFEPATFDEYAEPVPPGGANPPTPYDALDAIYAAARLLCANGAAGGADLTAAIYAYNHSTSYVVDVLDLANAYASEGVPSGATGP